MLLLKLILLLLVILLFYKALCFPPIRDNYLVMLIGKKRSGKTTFLARCSIHYHLFGRKVYATCPLPCARLIDYEDIGKSHFPPHSVIIIDEVGMIWDNRDFKSFNKDVRNYFKLQGHYKHTVIMASQSYDVDKKIRDLADMLGILEKSLIPNFSKIKWIRRSIVLTKAEGDQPSSVSENLSFYFPLFGGVSYNYLPFYWPYFDSYAAPQLEKRRYSVPDGMRISFDRFPFNVLVSFRDAFDDAGAWINAIFQIKPKKDAN